MTLGYIIRKCILILFVFSLICNTIYAQQIDINISFDEEPMLSEPFNIIIDIKSGMVNVMSSRMVVVIPSDIHNYDNINDIILDGFLRNGYREPCHDHVIISQNSESLGAWAQIIIPSKIRNANTPYKICIDNVELYDSDGTPIECPQRFSRSIPTIEPINKSPTISDVIPDKPCPQIMGTTITFKAMAEDNDNDDIYYRFDLNDEAQTDGNNSTWIWNSSDANKGDNTIKVYVRDDDHSYSEDNCLILNYTINKYTNLPPTIPSVRPDRPSPQIVGTTITFTAKARANGNDDIYYKFDLNDETQTDGNNSTWIWTPSNTDVGDNAIEVYVRDGNHSYSEDHCYFLTYRIEMPPPVIHPIPPVESSEKAPSVNSLAPTFSTDSPYVGASITWIANVSDLSEGHLLYRFDLKGPSTGNYWNIEQNWCDQDHWYWTPDEQGSYDIKVYVKCANNTGNEGHLWSNKTVYDCNINPNNRPAIHNIEVA